MTERTPSARYRDPLDEIWLAAAARCGLRVERSAAVYASYDGAGVLTLSTPEHFDADDSLAQLVLHELCHALVQGGSALHRPDWGLDNRTDRDLPAEHACHRLQAALLAPHGLRDVLAPTTEHRAYYDALPADPLSAAPHASPRDAARRTDAPPRAHAHNTADVTRIDDAPAVLAAARAGWERAQRGPWADALRDALAATAAIAAAVRPFARPPSIWFRGT